MKPSINVTDSEDLLEFLKGVQQDLKTLRNIQRRDTIFIYLFLTIIAFLLP